MLNQDLIDLQHNVFSLINELNITLGTSLAKM